MSFMIVSPPSYPLENVRNHPGRSPSLSHVTCSMFTNPLYARWKSSMRSTFSRVFFGKHEPPLRRRPSEQALDVSRTTGSPMERTDTGKSRPVQDSRPYPLPPLPLLSLLPPFASPLCAGRFSATITSNKKAKKGHRGDFGGGDDNMAKLLSHLTTPRVK